MTCLFFSNQTKLEIMKPQLRVEHEKNKTK
jgi:hypothetical protein